MPTGSLDTATAETVFALLMDVVHSTGTAALIPTHDPNLAQRKDRVPRLERGQLPAVARPALQPSSMDLLPSG
ncbi:P-loop NTPase family protein [Geminicoccus flavidas]|uniref:hypothetical protein n=1 Tax=Geminicoccus flavidas TaxID=2506407 RepID=UPI001357D153|nr:hypothetical protein [Geminicoccus flavidas]